VGDVRPRFASRARGPGSALLVMEGNQRMEQAAPTQVTRERERWPFVVLMALFSGSGALVLGYLVLSTGLRPLVEAGPSLWVLMIFGLFGELVPLTIARGDEENELSTSAAFVFAILLVWGPMPAALLYALASVGRDINKHKEWWKVWFNLGQYTLCLAAAAGTLNALGYHPSFEHPVVGIASGDALVILAAAMTFFLVNDLVVGAVIAVRDGAPIGREIASDFWYQLASMGALLAISPSVAVAALRSPWFVALLVVPILAVYRTGSLSVEKEHQSLHDALTGLPNRKLLHDRAGHALAEAVRAGYSAAVFLIDLDRFKEVNDTLGHHVGDELLQRVGTRIADVVRPGDTVARLGGDEFAILLPEIRDATVAEEIADRIRLALAVPFDLHGLTFELEGSIGIALCPDHGTDIDVLMQRADVAMYVAKETRARWERYSADRDRNSPERLGLLGDLRRAVEDGELVLHFQPKADLRTGDIVGAEALLRWQHRQRGLIFPDEFVPAAEQSGLIRSITSMVLDAGLSQLAQWRRDGLLLQLAINVSVRDLHDPRFCEQVRMALERYAIPAHQLALEITESVVIADADRVLLTLASLDDLGVGLSLDDFGAGYSSLTYLKQLPVSEIKIDKSFVVRMDVDDDDARIVRSTIDLAQALGLRVVAEGIETAQTWTRLARLGCDIAQGYYLSRPLPAAEFAEFVRLRRLENAAASA
jgi:diguanylate cyclase (GGDEF)-like protein